jgi:hypothetical protein
VAGVQHRQITMAHPSHPSRWQAAAKAAATRVLAARWRHLLECLELARAEQAQLRGSPLAEARAARRAAHRVLQLELLRSALARELRAGGPRVTGVFDCRPASRRIAPLLGA